MKNRRLCTKYYNKKVNSEKEGIPFQLTFEEFCILLQNSGITESDLGVKGFHLARYGDKGPYSIENCRFIHYTENIKEKVVTEKSRAASRKNIIGAINNRTKEERVRIAKIAAASSLHSPNSIIGKNKLTKETIEERLTKIRNSGVNLAEYGWVSKIAALLGMSHTHVRRFVKKHYPGNTFERK